MSFGTNDPNDNPYAFTVSGTVAAAPTIQTIDDSATSGFTTTAGWASYPTGFKGEMKYAAAGTGSKVATWTFTVTPGLYQVAATWVAQSNRATNSPFTVADGTTALGTVAVNQQLAPTDFTDQGVGWKTLGSFTISGNALVVTLTNAANQYVVADAIRIQKIG